MTDQLPTFSKTTEVQGHLNNPRRIAELIARCFDRATLDIGPIFRISRDLGDPFRRCPGLCPPAVSM